jgi:hydroxymethylbilane synthase
VLETPLLAIRSRKIMSTLRIGTRGSPLALAQTEATRRQLIASRPELGEPGGIAIVVIKTTGDKILDHPLAEIGGKGLFSKEIDEALLDGRIDLAVHSVKDLPTRLPDGLVLAASLPREDPRDVLFAPAATSIGTLPAGAVVGTASLRRQAQLLYHRPDLNVVPVRGNVQTRLARVSGGEFDATLLALAGLHRLGITEAITAVLDPKEMLPAVGQGAIGLTCRTGDAGTRGLLATLDHGDTSLRVAAERAMLEVLDGSCRTPIAGLAEVTAPGRITLRGLIAQPDGSRMIETVREDSSCEAHALGVAVGEELRRLSGPDFFRSAETGH